MKKILFIMMLGSMFGQDNQIDEKEIPNNDKKYTISTGLFNTRTGLSLIGISLFRRCWLDCRIFRRNI